MPDQHRLARTCTIGAAASSGALCRPFVGDVPAEAAAGVPSPACNDTAGPSTSRGIDSSSAADVARVAATSAADAVRRECSEVGDCARGLAAEDPPPRNS